MQTQMGARDKGNEAPASAFRLSPFAFRLSPFIFSLLFAFVAAQFAASPVLTVGERDGRMLAGVNDVERIGGRTVRWTNGEGVLTLPRTTVLGPLLLEVGLLNARPADQPEPQVQLVVDGAAPVAFTLPRSLSGEGRRYRLLLPPGPRAQVQARIVSDKMLLPADPRPLGVVVTGARIAPAGAGLRVPSPVTLAALSLVGLCLAALLRAAGLRPLPALAVGAAAVAGLAWGGAARPAEVLPFLLRLAALGLLAVGALWLAHYLGDWRWEIGDRSSRPRPGSSARSASRRPGEDAQSSNLPLAIAQSPIAILPILMGLAWWSMPAFQLIMLADGARPAIAPQTLVIGAFVALGLVALAAVRLIAGRSVAAATVWLLLAASLAHGAYLVWYAYTRSAPDFWIHFKGARGFVRDGLPLYDIPAIQANHFGFAYKWPPLYAALLAPFVFQAGELVLLGHRIMNTVLLVATAALLVWDAASSRDWNLGIGKRAKHKTNANERTGTASDHQASTSNLQSQMSLVAAILMLFNWRPATDTIALGQFDIVALFCCTLAWVLLRRGRDGWAGALIAFLALIKLYPALLLGFFVAARRWRALAGFALGGLACTAYSVAVLGWQNHVTYLADVVTRIGGGTSWIENQTFNGFASRLFAPTIAADKFDYAPVTLATYAFFVVTVGLAVLLTANLRLDIRDWKASARAMRSFFGRSTQSTPSVTSHADVPNLQSPIAFSLFVTLMILSVPAAWMHYEATLILPFALLLIYGGDAITPGRAVAIALAYALVSYGNQWSFFNGEVLGGLSILGYSYKFYGMLLLFGASVAVLLSAQRELQPSERAEQLGRRDGATMRKGLLRSFRFIR
jgi:hypothetical protein